MQSVGRRISWLTAAVIAVTFGCGPAAPGAQEPRAAPGARPDDSAPARTLVIGQPNPRQGFGPMVVQGSGRVLQYEELHSNFMVTTDAQGNTAPRLAASLPSFDDGTLAALPDGRLRASWKLRPDVKWHDGAAFTSADLLFGWEVSAHPEMPVSRSPTFRAIASMEAPDPLTTVVTFSTTFYKALELGFRDLYPLPVHLLAQAFQGDKDAFAKLPYWSSEYVHTGPYRVSEFVAGETLVFARYDAYFLGRPKVDRIVIHVIRDNNSMLSNVLAGSVDIAGELPTELATNLKLDWEQTGAGYVLSVQGNWSFASIQFHPEWGGPPELQSDVRARRGLALGIDSPSLRAALAPGYPDTEPDTFMVRSDPRAPLVGRPFAQYRYDPSAALRELAEVGWRRGPDGRMLNPTGQQVRLDLRGTGGNPLELSAVAGNWRDLGIDVAEELPPRQVVDPEYWATFPGIEITQQSNGDGVFRRFDSRLQPSAENRYVGSNAGHYVNPTLDRLADTLYSTIDERQQGLLLKEMGEIIARELPVLPIHFTVSTLVALKHVRGLDDFAGATRVGTTARHAHLWDRQ
jgi:peptide/nickel transport system substrate-binding protein